MGCLGVAPLPVRFGRFNADDVDVDGPAQADDLVYQGLPQEFAPARSGRLSHHDLRDIVLDSVLDDCLGHRCGRQGRHLGAETFRQSEVLPDPFPIFLEIPGAAGGFDVDRQPRGVQLIGQAAGGTDELLAGGAAADADEEPLTCRPGAGNGLRLHVGPHLVVHPGCGPPEGEFAQGNEIAGLEELPDGHGGLFGDVDLSFAQTLEELFGGDIHQADLGGLVEQPVRNRLPDHDPGDLGHHVVEALEVLDIDRGVDVDAGPEKLLHILPPLLVTGAGGVGVGQFVHQDDLGLPGKHRIKVHLREGDPLVRDQGWRNDLQPFQEGVGLRTAVGLHVPRHHVPTFEPPLAGRLQHGIGLPHPGGIAEEDLEPGLRLAAASSAWASFSSASGEGRLSSSGPVMG